MRDFYNCAQIFFSLDKEIGCEGKNSNTFLAHDPQFDANIVVKRVHKKNIDSMEDLYSESQTLYKSAHPNIAQIHYACQDLEYLYIVMPHYKNGSLNQLINKRYLTVREIITLSTNILSGLQNIHSKRLIHFDIKPDNILISDRNEALITDFGLAKHTNLGGRADQDRTYLKTMPPEATKIGQNFTVGFDIYQFGLTLYRMCYGNHLFYEQYKKFQSSTGKIDFSSLSFALRNGQFPDRKLSLEHIPDKIKSVIKKCLEPELADRYKATVDVVNDLSVIDENLFDWQYTQNLNMRSWSKQVGDKVYDLVVNNDGSSLATKKMIATGKTTRVLEFCKDSLSSKDIKAFLKEN